MKKIKLSACPVHVKFLDVDTAWNNPKEGYSWSPSGDEALEFEDKEAVARWLRELADAVEAT